MISEEQLRIIEEEYGDTDNFLDSLMDEGIDGTIDYLTANTEMSADEIRELIDDFADSIDLEFDEFGHPVSEVSDPADEETDLKTERATRADKAREPEKDPALAALKANAQQNTERAREETQRYSKEQTVRTGRRR